MKLQKQLLEAVEHIHSRTARQTDGCRHPQACSSSQAPDHILLSKHLLQK